MYNFIDVNEASESVVLPSEALKINGAYIEDQIEGYRTLNVSGREALSPEVETYTTGNRDGSKIKNKRYPERIIIVTYQLKAETSEAFREAYNKLAQILDVEDAELIFNDEQDKFFVGTPCTIGSVKPGTNSVVGEIEIVCADPFKYSVIEYEAEADLDEGSVLIDYNGTYDGYPTLIAEFYNENEASEDGETEVALTGHGDCGYVAFFTEDEKIIQLGNPDEVDGENTYDKSQTLVNSSFKTSSAWGSAAKKQWAVNSGVVSSSAVEQVGSVGMDVVSYTSIPKPANTVTTSGTLLTATSKAEEPYIHYRVTARATGRTANSVRVTLSITAALPNTNSYWTNDGVLITSVYIGGAWRNITMKSASENWENKTAHTKNITVTVSGLSPTAVSLTGIKFKAYRNDNLGDTGVLAETACASLPISPYSTGSAGGYYLTSTDFGTGSNWHGGSITRTIPADASGAVGAKNFTLSYSQKMSIGTGSTATNQLGAFQAILSDASGKIVCGVNVYKGGSGRTAKLRFYTSSGVAQTMDVDLSYNNKYFQSGKSSTITKSGQTVDFNICGIKKTFRDSAIADAAVTKVTFTFSKFGTKAPLSYNGLYWAKFVKNNCDTWKNVPNKFSANDILEADCKNGEIYLNGVLAPALGAVGNDWEEFCLTPGLNQIGFSYSEWVKDGYAPLPKIRYREVFL